MNLSSGKSLPCSKCLLFFKIKALGRPGIFSNCVLENPRISQRPSGITRGRWGGRESRALSPQATLPWITSPFLCLLSYAVLPCAILFAVKFPWLQRTFKTTELDDHPRIPKEKFLNSLKATTYFCGVFLRQVGTQHEPAHRG